MSYILSGASNPLFSLRSLIVAPMIQSQVLASVNPDGKVQGLLSYQGITVEEPEERQDTDETLFAADIRQQYANFEVIQDGMLDIGVGNTYRIALTEHALEHELFAFIPLNIKQGTRDDFGDN